MSDQKSYQGSCHCGQVKYSVSLSPPLEQQDVIQCNCSICSRNGYLFVYSKAADLQSEHSDSALKEYRFASKNYPHYFCTTCGTSLYAKGSAPDGGELVAVNVRTINDVDIKALKFKEIDGRKV
ncbi:GFA family protein [Aspergillus tanneri]|uniref:CENP-V/GFA domain-containing protein n=1 Tax=Aspergillus tanneri TaxID=1220188 RepID=A0A5M9MSQ8_9EURO|nr:uncharacterized protein ATNIH1004_002863 [Aspergillus tanneri]KAA8650182.1 hypothetical protein ATNIH1004_002863 [Aspergillus tanneri]